MFRQTAGLPARVDELRVVVAGAGSIGALLGAYVNRVARRTLLVDGWQPHVEAMRAGGLAIGGVRGERTFPVEALTFDRLSPGEGQADVVFVCVKSQDTEATAERVAPLVGDATVIVSTQNGLNEEALAARFGRDRVIGAVTEVGAFVERPGRVVETRAGGGFVVGELDGRRSSRCRTIAELMSACAPTEVNRNIVGLLWSKLVWNCMMNPVSALSGLGQGEVILDEDLRERCLSIGREAGAVAAAAGVILQPLDRFGIDPAALVGPAGERRDAAERQLVRRYSTQRGKTTSMRQDVLAGRPTEVDHLNGYVVCKGRDLGVATPANEEVVRQVHALEGERAGGA